MTRRRHHRDRQRSEAPEAGRLTLVSGPIIEVDYKRNRLRIQQLDRQGTPTYWLDVLERGVRVNQFYIPPDGHAEDDDKRDIARGIVTEDGEDGVCLGCHYTDETRPPVVGPDQYYAHFSDGTQISYDRDKHHLRIAVPESEGDDLSVEIVGGGTVRIAAENITLSAEELLKIAAKKLAMNIEESSTLTTTGGFDINATGKVKINGSNVSVLGGVDSDGDTNVADGQ